MPISIASAILLRYANAMAFTISIADGIQAIMVIPAKEADMPMAATAEPNTCKARVSDVFTTYRAGRARC